VAVVVELEAELLLADLVLVDRRRRALPEAGRELLRGQRGHVGHVLALLVLAQVRVPQKALLHVQRSVFVPGQALRPLRHHLLLLQFFQSLLLGLLHPLLLRLQLLHLLRLPLVQVLHVPLQLTRTLVYRRLPCELLHLLLLLHLRPRLHYFPVLLLPVLQVEVERVLPVNPQRVLQRRLLHHYLVALRGYSRVARVLLQKLPLLLRPLLLQLLFQLPLIVLEALVRG